MKFVTISACFVLVFCLVVPFTFGSPAFTYQGRLQDAGSPADGLYDLQFRLFDDPNVPTGVQVGSTVTADDMDVDGGYFTAYLDFGEGVFDGSDRWLQVGIRPYDSADPNDFVPLYPRLELTPTPYAMSVAAPLELSASVDSQSAVIKGSNASGYGTGVYGESANGYGMFGKHLDSGNWGSLGSYQSGVKGVCWGGTPGGYGIEGHATGPSMYGVFGISNVNSCKGYLGGETEGVLGESYGFYGVHGDSTNGTGVYGSSTYGYAGFFDGPKSCFFGDVGIGIESPQATLHVVGSTRLKGSLSIFGTADVAGMSIKSNSGDLDFWNTEAGAIEFWTGTQLGTVMPRMAIMPEGDVGIGTSSPTEKLQVVGTVKASAFVGNGSGLTNLPIDIPWNSCVGGICYTDGRVGIGTSSPVRKLDVQTGSGIGIYSQNNDSSTYAAFYGTNTGGGPAARFQDGNVLVVNGKLGIGETAPEKLLDIVSSGNAFISMQRGGGDTLGGIAWEEFGVTGTQWIFPFFRGWQSDNLIVRDEAGLRDVMTFEAGTGRVGIGTRTPAGTLDVNGSIYQRGASLHADYVFEEDYPLESIDEHAAFMYTNKHLRAIPKARIDENGVEVVEVGSHRKGIVEELEKAHIYIHQLNEENKQLHQRLETLEQKLEQVLNSGQAQAMKGGDVR